MKNSLKIQDFKTKLSASQIVKSKSLKNVKGGKSDPPPFGMGGSDAPGN